MKSLIQSVLVVAALCIGVAVSMLADGGPGSGLVLGNNSILPDAAPLSAECKVQARQFFASCVQSPHTIAPSQSEKVML